MQALPFVKQLRSRLQIEIAALPECVELERTERMLGIYEQIIIQRGLERKDVGPKVQKAFDHLILVAREALGANKPRPALAARKVASAGGASAGGASVGGAVEGAPFARWLRAMGE